MTYKLRTTTGTHPGQIYQNNEDTVFAYVQHTEEGGTKGLLIVADGVGGHKAGEVASQLAVETIFQKLKPYLDGQSEEPPSPSDLEKRLMLAVQGANAAINEYAQENREDAGNLITTVTAALISGNLAAIANVGDSRTYLFRNGKLDQLTQDHSFVGELVNQGSIEPEEIYDHPRRSIITRALGNKPGIEVDVQSITLQSSDLILLCSDGLWEMVRDQEALTYILRPDNPIETAVQDFIDAANVRGGEDNIGVVLAEFIEEW